MAKIPQGTWSAMNYEAIRMGTQLQLMAQADIRKGWAVKDDALTLEGLRYDEFLKRLEATDSDPEAAEEFRTQLAALLVPIIQQALTMPPEGGPQGQ